MSRENIFCRNVCLVLSFNVIPCVELDILVEGRVQGRLICKSFKAWPLKLLNYSDKEKALQVLETNLLSNHKFLIELNEVNQLTTLQPSSSPHSYKGLQPCALNQITKTEECAPKRLINHIHFFGIWNITILPLRLF